MGLPQTGRVPAWSLGDRLRKARDQADLSQAALAKAIGIARASVINYESGRSTPNRPVLLSWALQCGVDFGWLAGSPHPGLTNVGDHPDVRNSPRCTASKAPVPVAA